MLDGPLRLFWQTYLAVNYDARSTSALDNNIKWHKVLKRYSSLLCKSLEKTIIINTQENLETLKCTKMQFLKAIQNTQIKIFILVSNQQ